MEMHEIKIAITNEEGEVWGLYQFGSENEIKALSEKLFQARNSQYVARRNGRRTGGAGVFPRPSYRYRHCAQNPQLRQPHPVGWPTPAPYTAACARSPTGALRVVLATLTSTSAWSPISCEAGTRPPQRLPGSKNGSKSSVSPTTMSEAPRIYRLSGMREPVARWPYRASTVPLRAMPRGAQ